MTANPDTFSATGEITQTTTPVTANDQINGAPVVLGTGGNAVLTPGTAPAGTGITMDPATGVITVPAGTPAGSYPFPYTVCAPAGAPCATATATVVVGSIAPVPVNDWRALAVLAMLMAGFSAWQVRRRSH